MGELTPDQCFALLESELGIETVQGGWKFRTQSLGNNFYQRMLETVDRLKPSIANADTHVPWQIVFNAAETALGARPAIEIAQEMLRAMSAFQSANGRWIHKGLPYYLIWLRCRQEGWDWQMRRFVLLTLIEDAMRDFDGNTFNSESSGAYREATRDFALTGNNLNQFAREVKQISDQYQGKERWAELILHELLKKSHIARRVSATSRAAAQFEPLYSITEPLLALLDGNTERVYRSGEALERLVAILFSTIPGAIVRESVKGLFQVDVFVDLSANLELSLQLGPRIIVECKDWERPADINVAAKLLSTCQTADCKLGVIVSMQGITGADEVKHATRVVLQSYLQFGVAIVVLDESSIRELILSGNVAGLLVSRIVDTRLGVLS